MQIFNRIKDLKEQIKNLKKQGKIISFVPTMGFLHQGHLSLINQAKEVSDVVIVSIFVNQKQFDDNSDYENYPNNLDDDINKLKSKKVDILFCPNSQEIYPNKNLINFQIDDLGGNLCGKARKGHFQGVLLVVTKLFNIVDPDIAIFGQKDFQQLQIIKRLVLDLNFNIKIISAEIFREKSGLAMSSRNSRLSKENLIKAANIYQILNSAKSEILHTKTDNLKEILEKTKSKLLQYFDKIDYLEICDEENLQIIQKFNQNVPSRIFVAVYLGQVRLIDNISL